MADLAGVITSQVDLLWSVALAMLVAELFLVGRFFSGRLVNLGCFSVFLLVASMLASMISMLFGYLSYGAAIDMVRREMINEDGMKSFELAELFSLIQFCSFALAMVGFVWLFALNRSSIGSQIDEGGA